MPNSHPPKLTAAEGKALRAFKEAVMAAFQGASLTMYGSKARGDSARSSDIDILVALKEKVTPEVEARVFDMAYRVSLDYDVVLGVIVQSDEFLTSPVAGAMPFYCRVMAEGIRI
jgi:predicted nucleotidyltransferase